MKYMRPAFYSLLFLVLFFIDRITKSLVMSYITSYEINSFFSLCFVQNTGISWGIADGFGQHTQYLIMLVVALLIGMIVQQTARKYKEYKNIIPEILVCAGAVSNLYDRVVHGGVIDFLSFQLGFWQFPIFNIADCMIVCGIFLICINEIIYHE